MRALAHSGMATPRAGGPGYLYLLTLTAPGEVEHRLPDGTPCGCTPAGGVDLYVWNTEHSRRWNHFRTVLRREVPELEFFRGVEVQVRGALHDHALVWSPVPLDKRWLRDLAIRCGFGHALDLAPCAPGSRKAAYYVSKYVTKACDARERVPWLDTTTGEVLPGRYRTWSMSRSWGLRMSDVCAQAAAYARLKAREQDQLSLVSALASLGAVFGPLEVLPAPDDGPPPPAT